MPTSTPGVLADTVVGDLAPRIEEFAAKLPKPYQVVTGGLYEESAVSRASVFAVVPLMIGLMLVIMMVQLVSFRRLAMVVGIMPLGLIGVVLTLLLFNRPLGFVAILGVLALIGMIAKNAVILIVQIETDRAEGKGVYDAVVASATSRMRPMMLAARLDRPRSAADCTHRVLGTDGVCHHGRAAGRNHADARAAAHRVRDGVRKRSHARARLPDGATAAAEG